MLTTANPRKGTAWIEYTVSKAGGGGGLGSPRVDTSDMIHSKIKKDVYVRKEKYIKYGV